MNRFVLCACIALISISTSYAQFSGDGPITTTDDVGIGLQSSETPATKLHVISTDDSDVLTIQSAQEDAGMRFYNGSNPNGANIRYDGATQGFEFRTNGIGTGATKFFIGDNGNIGIGRTDPTYGIHMSKPVADMRINSTSDNWAELSLNKSGGSNTILTTIGAAPDDKGYGYVGTNTNDPFVIRTKNTERIRITKKGKVGIGTSSPGSPLEISRGKFNPNDHPAVRIVLRADQWGSDGRGLEIVAENKTGTGDPLGYQGLYGTKGMLFIQGQERYSVNGTWKHDSRAVNVNNKLILYNSGSLYCKQAKVDGDVLAEEVKVQNVSGADFVFEEDYDLRSLQETEDFIQENGHLPEIQSAAEMKEEGLNLKEFNIQLLQKIEELTLYQIEMNKQMKEMKAEIDSLKNKK